ncbi:MAG: TIGR01458 family HAD-type hydrolase [Methanolinea sp.]|jgi:HAD superfamily hydrolase (TIGR01458 family)|nr:TIGR01458 family HAD-type hydrolase [Methanolinea sp.]
MSLRGFLIDLDGVIYTGGVQVPGAMETISWLRHEGYPFRFISNTTRRSRKSISLRLSAMNLDIPSEIIFTPAAAAAALVRQRGGSRISLLSTGDVHHDFEEAGLQQSLHDAEVVIVGDAGDNFTYQAMNRAFRLILEDVPFMALERDRYWMDEGGLSLSAGPFVAALEYATGRSAELVGKPSGSFFRMALDSMGLSPGECAMIGDDAVSDVQGAMDSGMAGFLVKTGKFRPEAPPLIARPPTAVLSSIAALPDYLQKSSQ